MLLAIYFALITAPPIEPGEHWLTLQWIDGQGVARFERTADTITLRGKHTAKDGDFVELDGTVSDVTATTFVFTGKVTTRVSHIAQGKACVRDGKVTFRATGTRKYWRMKENDNPCDAVADYVDIYFDGPKK